MRKIDIHSLFLCFFLFLFLMIRDFCYLHQVDKLQDQGINAADIKKLKEAGIHTIAAVMMHTSKALGDIKGLSDAKVVKIVAAGLVGQSRDAGLSLCFCLLCAASKIQDFGFMSGTKFLERRNKVVKMTTGSSALDELLGGGIETMV